jgi:hypothetical protein
MNAIANRAAEPSTWAGVAVIFQALGFFFPAYAGIFHGATLVTGCMAGAMPEGAKNELSNIG